VRYLALASDYDGTLAHDGCVDEATIRALECLVHSGRKLILVTGRELPDLQSVFPRLDLCERVVAENGALLYNPATKERHPLATPPPSEFIDALRARGVTDVSVGQAIVATWKPHEGQVLDVIRELGLELQIIFNKDAVMVLPSGVNKESGLHAALEELRLSPHNVVGVGDAENDHAFLDCCECAVAVANAIPSLKEKASLVTKGERGAGVSELIEHLLNNDLADLDSVRPRNLIPIGSVNGEEISLAPYGRIVLVCGQSGSGKSSFVMSLLEHIMERKYRICLVDPEGDYEGLPGCRTVGTAKHPPHLPELKQVLDESTTDVIVNLVGVATNDRPHWFATLIATIQEARLRTGHPHWIIIDEAHHVLPAEWAPASAELNDEFVNVVLITVHPEHVSKHALDKVNTVIVAGNQPLKALEEFSRATERTAPAYSGEDLERGHVLAWLVDQEKVYAPLEAKPSRTEHERHKRKYAQGELEEDRVFHFRGPEMKMDLRAQNLNTFVQLAEGVDSDTWQYHLRRGDYSHWMRHSLKDSQLADEIESVEKEQGLEDRETRARIIAAIQQKYTASA
jgi:hypothetical protein